MTIILQEAARYLFYAPFYAALSLRAFEKEGLDVRFEVSPHTAYTADAVLNAKVDVAWGGPSRLLSNYDRRRSTDLVAFAEVVTRDPFFVVGRTPFPNFAVRDFVGKRLGIVSEVPTPWHCLQEELRRAGIDPATLTATFDGTMPANIEAMRAGRLDAVQLFEPYVSEVVESGGFVWYAGASRGHTSFTSLYTRRETLASRRDEMKRMVIAIYKTQKWVAASPADEIAETVSSHFPAVPRPRLAAAIGRYKQAGVWGLNPRLPREGYERLKASFLSGGYIKTGLDYETAVDNSLAEEVIQELRG